MSEASPTNCEECKRLAKQFIAVDGEHEPLLNENFEGDLEGIMIFIANHKEETGHDVYQLL